MNPYSINPPTSEDRFEELCLALMKRHWSRKGLERFGKRGERQFGVDILDTLGESPLYAAQCKLKEQWKTLEPSEIETEVNKAKTFPSKLDHYVILTSAKVSTAAQLTVQAINQQHRAAGLFTVEVYHWNRLTDLIRQYPEIEQEFFGGLRSEEVAEVKSQLSYLVSMTESIASKSGTTEIDAMIDEARARINPKEAQIAIMLLNRVSQTKGGELSEWHRYRILTNLGAAHLMLGKATEAARYFLDATPLRPDDQLAVTNEVLAYHLLLQDEEARTKAALAVDRFPNCSRLRALWIQAAPLNQSYEELLSATPEHMRKDAEVASALSRRAMSEGLIDLGIDYAKDAIADKPKWSQARVFLAQAYFARVVMAAKPLKLQDRESTLANSIAAANDAIAAAEEEGVPYVKATALALQADIALLQGRKEDAARLSREAFAADPTELNGRLAIAQAAFSNGNTDEGIGILEEAYTQSNSAPNVCFMLGQALMGRGTESDLNRAVDVFNSAKTTGLSRELIDPLIVGGIRALARAKRFAEIPANLLRSEVSVSPVMVAAANAYVALKQGQNSEAGQFLNDAIALRQPTDTRAVADFLARTLMEAGRLSDALPLLQELFNAQTPNFDTGLLLNCASRLKQVKVILDTCQALYERGERDWDVTEFESQYLEEYDFPKAIARLQEFITANPDHRLAKLRLAIVALRYGRNDLASISEQTLPTPEELPMNYVVAAIHALQWQNKEELAVDYAYRVLRAHNSELEAHKAYLASVMPGSRPVDMPLNMDSVEVGSAVQYSEGDAASSAWFVIEDTDKPNIEFDELAASSPIAKELLGKKAGDTFVLAKSSIKDRVGTILQVISKYARRFQAIGEKMQLKFGEQSVIQTLRVPPPEQITATDLQPMLDSVKAQAEAVSQLREIYKSNTVPVYMYAERLGHSAHEGLLDLAVSENEFVKCVPPQREHLAAAIASLGAKSTIVVDLIALATLRLLGITRQILTSGSFRFVISPATYTELQQLRVKARFSTAHSTLNYEDGQHYMTETTAEQAEKEKSSFEEWMQCIEANTTIMPVPEVAALTPERREVLENVFGRDGLEAVLLALAPGHILWTDDGIFAEAAKTELGVERVWTQAVIEYIANVGLIDRAASNEAYAKLVGFNFQSTHFNGQTMLAAVRISNGSVERFPARQMIRVFGEIFPADKNSAFRLLAEFVFRLFNEPFLPETRCVVLKAFLDTFPNDPPTRTLLASFKRQCAQLFVFNIVAAADFNRCFDEWTRNRLKINLLDNL
jgi:transcription elongation GreA/GreB family factor